MVGLFDYWIVLWFAIPARFFSNLVGIFNSMVGLFDYWIVRWFAIPARFFSNLVGIFNSMVGLFDYWFVRWFANGVFLKTLNSNHDGLNHDFLNLQYETRNQNQKPEPETRNQKPETRKDERHYHRR